jgi:N-methylhydantoinase A
MVTGVQRVVRARMAKAMRLVLARRGLDPRDFTLLAFGGAGPMHAHALALEIGVPRVLVPFLPGAFSAYGILISDVRLEYSRSLVRPLDGGAYTIRRLLAALHARAAKDLAAQGLDARRAISEGSVDLRFRGQSYEINVPARGDLAASFRRAHRRRFGYARPGEPIELVTVRLVVRVPRRVRIPPPPSAAIPRETTRRCLFKGEWVEARVFDRSTLPAGFRAEGPVIIEEAYATTAVPPGASFTVDGIGLLEVEVAP